MAPDDEAATIIDLSHDGRGIADLDGRRIFVAGALPNEHVLLQRRRRRRRLTEADLVSITQPAPDRVTPKCEAFGRCGGCVLQHLSYPSQLEFKQRVVADAFRTIAKLEPREWLTPITGDEWAYRRRARLGIKYVPGKGRVLVGFRERAAPYVTDMQRCEILAPPLGEALDDLAATIGRTSIRDRMPQAEVAIGDDCGALVLRVLTSPTEDDRALLSEFGQRHDVDIYLQPSGPDSIEPLSGRPRTLRYRLNRFGLDFEFLPTDFIQINAAVNEAMVAAAIDEAQLEPSDNVLDLYCGLGNFSLPIALHAAHVCGVEGSGALVARAAGNAKLNGIDHVRFLTADLDQSDWPFFRDHWDVVLLDPSRTGAASAVQAMRSMNPRRVVYVSCHPGTLARDAAVLVNDGGYALDRLRVLDMFPHTHHVEAIATFVRLD